MPAIIEYLLRFSICISAVYLFYYLLLRPLTFYKWNRWYFWVYSVLAFILPVVNIMPQLRRHPSPVIIWLNNMPALPQGTLPAARTVTVWDAVCAVLLAVTAWLLIRLVVRLYSLAAIKKKARLLSGGTVKLYAVEAGVVPFSFGHAIFINKEAHTPQELEKIMRHELVHVRQHHTADALWAEVLCIINWYNPFAWALRHAVKQNLEYIADREVLQTGYDKKSYQYLLLKVMGHAPVAVVNNFNISSLKNRIMMMNKIKTASVHLLKFAFIIPLLAVLLLAFRKNDAASPAILLVNGNATDTLPAREIMIIHADKYPAKGPGEIVERIGMQEWNKHRAVYDKKYGKKAMIAAPLEKSKTGYDSVYVFTYQPKPIEPNTIYIVDGVEQPVESFKNLSPDMIREISILKDKSATDKYGERAKAGVIEIVTKKQQRQHTQDSIPVAPGQGT